MILGVSKNTNHIFIKWQLTSRWEQNVSVAEDRAYKEQLAVDLRVVFYMLPRDFDIVTSG